MHALLILHNQWAGAQRHTEQPISVVADRTFETGLASALEAVLSAFRAEFLIDNVGQVRWTDIIALIEGGQVLNLKLVGELHQKRSKLASYTAILSALEAARFTGLAAHRGGRFEVAILGTFW